MIKATTNHVIIEPELEPEISKSGLHIKTRKIQAVPVIGKVISSGVSGIDIDDRVVFRSKKDNPQGFKFNGQNLVGLEAEEILGVILES